MIGMKGFTSSETKFGLGFMGQRMMISAMISFFTFTSSVCDLMIGVTVFIRTPMVLLKEPLWKQVLASELKVVYTPQQSLEI